MTILKTSDSWPKEVWKSNFRQYGQTKKQGWEESEKRPEEKTRSEKRKRQKKQDQGARKGIRVANHCVFRMFRGFGVSKSRLAKAAVAEPFGQLGNEKLHAAVVRDFKVKMLEAPHSRAQMWKKRTPLWRDANFKVQMVNASHVWTTFGWSRHDNNIYSYNYNYHYITATTTLQLPLQIQVQSITVLQLQLQLHYVTLHYTNYSTNYSTTLD